MGQINTADSGIPKAKTIIDFLYVDKERADSYISQLRQGTLRSVTKTLATDEGSSFSAKGNTVVVNGEYKKDTKTSENAAEQYDPYHSHLIQLLEDLNIQPLRELVPGMESKLVLLQGEIAIRDVTTMQTLLKIINQSKMLGSKMGKEPRQIMKMFTEILGQLPASIFFSMNFDETNINGTLKPSALSIQQGDLMQTYGAQLPGEWYVLGILDSIKTPAFDKPPTVASIEDAIDVCTFLTNSLFTTSTFKIIPILIFRPVSTV